MAAGRKTGGRKKGTKNKRTVAFEQALESTRQAMVRYLGDLDAEADDIDAHGLLMAVYRNPTMPVELRVEAAGKSLPFEKPRLGSIDVNARSQGKLVIEVVDFDDQGNPIRRQMGQHQVAGEVPQ
jgi:hypothetical protein